MSKIITIYCEGTSGTHDYDILEKTIDEIIDSIQIEPIGSVRGAGAIIQHKESREIFKSSFFIFFRDRDFDKEIPSEAKLEQDEVRKYFYYSYRNTIENYLFNTTHFFEFIEKENLNEAYLIHSEQNVKEKFIEAAENIKVYQAVRHSMGKIRTGNTNFGTKWTEKSGKLPKELDETYCIKMAMEKINTAKSITDNWTEEYFKEVYDSFLTQFDTEFMNNLDFLIYFQGKDFATSLKSILPNFPLKSYYKYAKKNFDYTKHIDLVELKELLESNL